MLASHVIYCSDCDTWYTEKEVQFSKTCTCGGELRHAHEYNQQTPYMKARAELVKLEISSLEERLAQLKEQLRSEFWDE